MANEWDIEPGQTVPRRQGIHGGGGTPIRYGGAWYGGIEPSNQSPNILIFTEPEAGKQYGYNYDGWAGDDVLHYTGEGRTGDQRLVGGNAAIRDHKKSNRALRVFRANPPMATYLGQFEVDATEPLLWADAPDADGLVRQVVVFRLRPVGEFVRGDLGEAAPIGAPGAEDVPAALPATTADVPTEANLTSTFTLLPSDEPVEYQRREAALVGRYMAWLDGLGQGYGRKRITIPDQAGRLFTDLHNRDTDEMIEAKATSSRQSVRAGLGQLLDYARYVPHARKALLLPARPRPDLLELLEAYDCGCIWETITGKFERTAPALL